MLEFERECWARGYARVGGVDEAGRGPLAGPVVAAIVAIERDFAEREVGLRFADVNDSKQLDEPLRERCFELLRSCPAVRIGVGRCEADEIDRINILRATHEAMRRAIADLQGEPPDFVLVDGLPVSGFPCPSRAIVGGDGLSLSIAAASIVAKVLRDRHMRDLDRLYPGYGFRAHKGYGTAAHIQALFERGPSPIHRRTFRPVREAEAIRARRLGAGGVSGEPGAS